MANGGQSLPLVFDSTSDLPVRTAIKCREVSTRSNHFQIVEALGNPIARMCLADIENASASEQRQPFRRRRQFAKELGCIAVAKQRQAFVDPLFFHSRRRFAEDLSQLLVPPRSRVVRVLFPLAQGMIQGRM